MTALLTDAMLSDICHKNIGVQGATGAAAREVRSIYEARLAEDAKVRAEMTAALEQARAWVRGDDEPKILLSRIDAALAAAKVLE